MSLTSANTANSFSTGSVTTTGTTKPTFLLNGKSNTIENGAGYKSTEPVLAPQRFERSNPRCD